MKDSNVIAFEIGPVDAGAAEQIAQALRTLSAYGVPVVDVMGNMLTLPGLDGKRYFYLSLGSAASD